MIKSVFKMLIAFSFFNTYSQIKFEKGYYIDNNNKRIECLIKNEDWLNNPDEFKYKLDSISDINKASINEVKEFYVANSKYERHLVQIDNSSQYLDQLTTKKDPNWEKKQIFLKCLVVSGARLYSYTENVTGVRFFYAKNDDEPMQLIYKQFLDDNGNILTNDTYKQQLWNDVKCEDKKSDLNTLNYNEKALVRYFNKVNKCNGNDSANDEIISKTQDRVDVRLLIGNRLSKYEISPSVDFGQINNFNAGLEAEYFFPFNKNKWSLVASILYNFNVSKEITEKTSVPSYDKLWKIEDSSINFLFGGRYSMYLNSSSRFFIRASYSLLLNNSKLDYNYISNPSQVVSNKIPSSSGFLVGFGYEYKRFSFEARYTENSIFDTSIQKNNLGLNLGFALIQTNKNHKK